MILSQLIKAYRAENKISLRKMALEIGIDHTTLCRFENGDTETLSIDNFHKILVWIFGP
jgi:transcriptional regulator with XRE-family HTH domain